MISMPNAEVAGIIRLSLVIMTILLFRPNAFGMDGPVMSASRIAVCFALTVHLHCHHGGDQGFADAALAADYTDYFLNTACRI